MGSLTRDRKPLRSLGIEWICVPFQFTPNSSDSTAAPTAANVLGSGVSVTIQGTGLYRVQIQGGAPNMVIDLSPPQTALKGLYQLELGTVSATAGQFQIRVFNFGTTTLANFAATTSQQVVQGIAWLQCSSYTR